MKVRVALLVSAAIASPAIANECAMKTSRANANISGIVNTYYPVLPRNASNGYSSGEAVIPVGPMLTCTGCATDPIVVGDQVMLIQFMDASFTNSNTITYGDGATGRGMTQADNNALGMARYTLMRVIAVAGSNISVGHGDGNIGGADFVFGTGATQGRPRGAMLVRIPQYANATLTGPLTAPPFQNGTIANGNPQQVGGIVIIDVAGTLNLNGQTIDVSGKGFRGGAGRQLTGSAVGVALNTDYVRNTTFATSHGTKGEGYAGMPRYVYDTATSAILDNNYLTSGGFGATDGYIGGSLARGAPGNAGGGGTDANPTPATTGNTGNTGGGGGAGYGNGGTGGTFAGGGGGGIGGFGYTESTINGAGRRNGAANAGANAYVLGTWQMAMFGGGGGSGSANTAGAIAASGAPGGGIVIVRANSITGSGTIRANGGNASNAPTGDAGGGGGGGGWIIVGSFDQTRVANPSISLEARGGNGGSVVDGGNNAGPGGGGGGGAIAVTTTLNPYVSGTTSGGLAGSAPGGSTSTGVTGGSVGDSVRQFGFYQFGVGPGGASANAGLSRSVSGGAECVPFIKKSYDPPQAASGANRTFKIQIINPNDGLKKSTIQDIALTDTYPTGVVNAAVPNLTNNGNCGPTASGGSAATPGDNKFVFSGGEILGGATCEFTMTVTATGSGTLTNTIAQDAVTGTMGSVGGAIPTANPSPASASLTFPSTVTANKTSAVVSDPINNSTNPKRIPGATVDYTIAITNASGAVLDNNSMVITDALPTQTKLFVNNLPSLSAPYEFTANSSNLTCSTGCLGYSTMASPSATDDAHWAYTPTPDADGADSAVTHIRFKTSGSMAIGSDIAFRYRTLVK